MPEQSIARFAASLPFRLTNAQTRVLSEIVSDMRAPAPMNRLVQGDVGCGKTAIALGALYLSRHGGQAGRVHGAY